MGRAFSICIFAALLASVAGKRGQYGRLPEEPPVTHSLFMHFDAAYGTLDGDGNLSSANSSKIVRTWKDVATLGGENDAIADSDARAPFLEENLSELKNQNAVLFKNAQEMIVSNGLTQHMDIDVATFFVIVRAPFDEVSWRDVIINAKSNTTDLYFGVMARDYTTDTIQDAGYYCYLPTASGAVWGWIFYGFKYASPQQFWMASGRWSQQDTISMKLTSIVSGTTSNTSESLPSTIFPAAQFDSFHIGGLTGYDYYMKGEIAEIMVYSIDLQEDEWDETIQYVLWKYTRPCDSSCDTCGGPRASDCLSCPDGVYFLQGSCVSSCPQSDSVFAVVKSWTFESGNLTASGFTAVDNMGVAFESQPVLAAGMDSSNYDGDYFIRTDWQRNNLGGNGGDRYTGIAYSDSWVVGKEPVLKFLIAGGNLPCSSTFDPATVATTDNMVCLTLERLTSNGWVVIFTQTGTDKAIGSHVLVEYSWDLGLYTGDTVRIGLYDLSVVTFGHLEVDDIRYYADGPIDVYADDGIMECVSALECPDDIAPFADPTTRKCVKTCPTSLPLVDRNTMVCSAACPNGTYASRGYCEVNCNTFGLYFNDATQACEENCTIGYESEVQRSVGDDLETYFSCVSTCPNGTYPEDSDHKCVSSCPDDLYTDGSSCVASCSSGKFAEKLSMQCLTSCPAGYYADSATNTCTTTCSGSTFGDASTRKCVTSCPKGSYAQYNQGYGYCVSVCNTGTYGDSTTNQCVSPLQCNGFATDLTDTCVSSCIQYNQVGNATTKKCQSACSPLTYNYNGVCTTSCPPGTYTEDVTQQCDTSCTKGYADDSTRSCVINCTAPGYYADDATQKCVTAANCASGLFGSPLSKKCVPPIQCLSVGFAANSSRTCVATCAQGLFGDPLTGMCVATCDITTTPPYFADVDEGKCVEHCASGYFADNTTATCVSSCQPSGLFNDPVNNICVSSVSCPDGYYADLDSYACVTQCTPPMIESQNPPQCVSQCVGTQFSSTIMGACVDNCPEAFYGVNSSRSCVSTCPSPYFANVGKTDLTTQRLCVLATDCPAGTFGDNFERACESSCRYSYADPVSKQCVTTCPSGPPAYFANDQTGACVLSKDCTTGTYADASSGKCVDSCPGGLFGDVTPDGSRVCVSASDCSNSQKAIPGPPPVCGQSCPANMFVRGNTEGGGSNSTGGGQQLYAANLCVFPSACADELLFANPETGECSQSCPVDLVGDGGTGTCGQFCPGGFALINDNTGGKECTPTCQADHYATGAAGIPGSECKPCNSSCLTCANDSTHCTSCTAGLTLQSNFSCGTGCDVGEYARDASFNGNTLIVCSKCDPSCATCYTRNACNTCPLTGTPYLWRGTNDDGLCHAAFNTTRPCPLGHILKNGTKICIDEPPQANTENNSNSGTVDQSVPIAVGVILAAIVIGLVIFIVIQRKKQQGAYVVSDAPKEDRKVQSMVADQSDNPVFEESSGYDDGEEF